MPSQYVAVAANHDNGETLAFISYENGVTHQRTFPGKKKGGALQILEDVFSNVQPGQPIILVTEYEPLLEKSQFIWQTLPQITNITVPYDDPSEDMYRSIQEKILQAIPQKNPHPDVIRIASDASVSSGYAVWAWVSLEYRRNAPQFKFDFGTSTVLTSHAAETLGIIRAGISPRKKLNAVVYSDSQSAIQTIKDILSTKQTELPEPLKGLDKDTRNETRSHLQALTRRADEGKFEVHWVKGHAGHSLNVLADQIATYARRRLRTEPSRKVIRAEIHQMLDAFRRNGTVQIPAPNEW